MSSIVAESTFDPVEEAIQCLIERMRRAADKLVSIQSIDEYLTDLILSVAGMIGAAGGAYGIASRDRSILRVRDVYPGETPQAASKGLFELPLTGRGPGVWSALLNSREEWWADIEDERFTPGFREYHRLAGRTRFVHYPIFDRDSIIGFLGFSFCEKQEPAPVLIQLVRTVAQQVGLMVRLGDLAISNPIVPSGVPGSVFARRVDARIAELVEAGPKEGLHIVNLAADFGFSVRQFHGLFTQAFGTTPHRYVVTKRLDRAAKFLLEGKPVAWVAHECGFADQGHLAKCFRMRYGCRPAHYRSMR